MIFAHENRFTFMKPDRSPYTTIVRPPTRDVSTIYGIGLYDNICRTHLLNLCIALMRIILIQDS